MVDVRPAHESDRAATSDLVERALAEYAGDDALMHEGYLRYSLDPGHAEGSQQLVATLDGRIVGSVLFVRRVRNREGWPASAATFGTLVVDPEIRRRGIGAALVKACIDAARASGASGVVIETMPFMTTGQVFYGPFGFERWEAGDWDGTEILRSILGRHDVPRTRLSAWRLDFD